MATQTLTSMEEYLRTSFEGPDREYLDGELVERGMPDEAHSMVQARSAHIAYLLGQSRPVFPRTELRMRISERRCRVPDFALFLERPTERVPTRPPLLIIEILSPDDRMTDLVRKLDEFRAWGVTHTWVVDPELRRFYVYDGGSLQGVASFRLPELDATITPQDLLEG